MFQSKTRLRQQVFDLKEQNAILQKKLAESQGKLCELEELLHFEQHHNRRSALVEAADLPKCKSPACYSCKHIAYVLHPGNGGLYLIGCGKGLSCHDFCEREEAEERIENLREMLYSMAKYYFPNLKSFPADDCVHIPQPPCHSDQGDKST